MNGRVTVVVTGGSVVGVVTGTVLVVVVGSLVVVVVGGTVDVVVGGSVVVVVASVVVVVMVVVVVDGGTSLQLLIVNTFLLSIQCMPPSHGRFSLPLPVQVLRSVNATVGLTSGVL